MTLKTIDLDHTSLTLDELLAELTTGAEVLLTRGETPVARLLPAMDFTVQMAGKRVLGLHEGEGWISDDFTDPLPDSFWIGSE